MDAHLAGAVDPAAGRSMPPPPRYPMPDFIREALNHRQLMDTYRSSPPHRQNDCIGSITRAKVEATKQKRLTQMLEKLEGGKLYIEYG